MKEVVLEPLLSKGRRLSVRVDNQALPLDTESLLAEGGLCPVSLMKWNISINFSGGFSTQLWVLEPRRGDLFSHRGIIPFRVIQGKWLKNYLLGCTVHEIILQKEVERKK